MWMFKCGNRFAPPNKNPTSTWSERTVQLPSASTLPGPSSSRTSNLGKGPNLTFCCFWCHLLDQGVAFVQNQVPLWHFQWFPVRVEVVLYREGKMSKQVVIEANLYGFRPFDKFRCTILRDSGENYERIRLWKSVLVGKTSCSQDQGDCHSDLFLTMFGSICLKPF